MKEIEDSQKQEIGQISKYYKRRFANQRSVKSRKLSETFGA